MLSNEGNDVSLTQNTVNSSPDTVSPDVLSNAGNSDIMDTLVTSNMINNITNHIKVTPDIIASIANNFSTGNLASAVDTTCNLSSAVDTTGNLDSAVDINDTHSQHAADDDVASNVTEVPGSDITDVTSNITNSTPNITDITTHGDIMETLEDYSGMAANDSRVVQAIFVSHNGPGSFPNMKTDESLQNLGSPYIKITERDGKFDSWVVLPLHEFQELYQNNIELVRKHLFGATSSRTDQKAGVFPCEDCGYVYNREYNLRRHRREKHAVVVKRIRCPYCGKYYVREDNLVRHVRIVHNCDEQCICIHCGAEFNRYSSLKRHIMAKHRDEKKFPCPLCDARFSYKWEVKIHNQNYHAAEAGFNCDKCGKTFKRPQTLQEHKKFYHEGNRVICKIDNCNELFNTMANFKKHKREMHVEADTISKRGPKPGGSSCPSYSIVSADSVGEIKIYCQLCGKACHGKHAITKHYRNEHMNQKSRKQCSVATTLYKCTKCSSTFRTRENYERHYVKYHPDSPSSSGTESAFVQDPCCDGECDTTDFSVTSELLALQQVIDNVTSPTV